MILHLLIKREVLCILLNLRESNRTSSEKSKLVSIYLDNRNEVNKQKLKSLICNSLVLSTYTYIEQLSIINSFIEDNSIYKDTMEKCYIMALEI